MKIDNPLHRLTRLYGVQTVYRDGLGTLRSAPAEAAFAVLRALGAPVESFNDIGNALRQRRQTLWQGVVDPVVVNWQDQPLKLRITLPRRIAEARIEYRIECEFDGELAGELRTDPGTDPVAREIDGARYVRRRLLGPTRLPAGYHRLSLEIAGERFESLLICAPEQAYRIESVPRRWGLFCPLYALRSAGGFGAGAFADLDAFVDFTAEVGGHAVATLPLLASFLDEPFNPSPYAPVSRLFWSELYLDIERIPEFQNCQEAQSLCAAADLQTLRTAPLVDYRAVMARKRAVLEALAGSFLNSQSTRRSALENFVAAHPTLQDYAEFRATRAGRFDDAEKNYHLYVQWLCAEQIAQLRDHASGKSIALYLDFPLGVNRDGFDVARQPELFALGISGGAPPDGLFIKGQNWGFPPLHPETIRRQGYRYYIDCVRHHMSAAAMLRIDHVMGLHRAYWVPEGFGATDGVYVHYRADEFHAILNLESQCQQVQIVGENLGTVPDKVNQTMARRKIFGMHVGQFRVGTDGGRALDSTPIEVVASLNTHDTPTFMGFWREKDIDDRVDLSLLDQQQSDNERRYRAAQRAALTMYLRHLGYLGADESPAAVRDGWLKFLAAQPAEFLLINLEDLWLEAEPQNVPGTWRERPNWRRKARHSLDHLRGTADSMDLLRTIRDIRARMV